MIVGGNWREGGGTKRNVAMMGAGNTREWRSWTWFPAEAMVRGTDRRKSEVRGGEKR